MKETDRKKSGNSHHELSSASIFLSLKKYGKEELEKNRKEREDEN